MELLLGLRTGGVQPLGELAADAAQGLQLGLDRPGRFGPLLRRALPDRPHGRLQLGPLGLRRQALLLAEGLQLGGELVVDCVELFQAAADLDGTAHREDDVRKVEHQQ